MLNRPENSYEGLSEDHDLAVVVIGRNEGQRLVDCLRSLGAMRARTVYVDSGSTDKSLEAAAALGVAVLHLDMRLPFTAARARNAGLSEARRLWPQTRFIQFVDGDCELDIGWIGKAHAFLQAHDRIAAVFGRRRERFPERSVFNALCDREWAGAPGSVTECGGDVAVRLEALQEAGTYRDDLIAGEEPELCVRLREKGWTIWRLAAEMTRHDANITTWRQWWRRSVRCGHAFAEVSQLHRGSPFRIWKRSLSRSLVWGGVLPVVAVGGAFVHPVSLALIGLYPLQIMRLALQNDDGLRFGARHAAFSVLGKFPELQGTLTFHANRLRRRRSMIIEYK